MFQFEHSQALSICTGILVRYAMLNALVLNLYSLRTVSHVPNSKKSILQLTEISLIIVSTVLIESSVCNIYLNVL